MIGAVRDRSGQGAAIAVLLWDLSRGDLRTRRTRRDKETVAQLRNTLKTVDAALRSRGGPNTHTKLGTTWHNPTTKLGSWIECRLRHPSGSCPVPKIGTEEGLRQTSIPGRSFCQLVEPAPALRQLWCSWLGLEQLACTRPNVGGGLRTSGHPSRRWGRTGLRREPAGCKRHPSIS